MPKKHPAAASMTQHSKDNSRNAESTNSGFRRNDDLALQNEREIPQLAVGPSIHDSKLSSQNDVTIKQNSSTIEEKVSPGPNEKDDAAPPLPMPSLHRQPERRAVPLTPGAYAVAGPGPGPHEEHMTRHSQGASTAREPRGLRNDPPSHDDSIVLTATLVPEDGPIERSTTLGSFDSSLVTVQAKPPVLVHAEPADDVDRESLTHRSKSWGRKVRWISLLVLMLLMVSMVVGIWVIYRQESKESSSDAAIDLDLNPGERRPPPPPPSDSKDDPDEEDEPGHGKNGEEEDDPPKKKSGSGGGGSNQDRMRGRFLRQRRVVVANW